jgi:hypothetical protein
MNNFPNHLHPSSEKIWHVLKVCSTFPSVFILWYFTLQASLFK